MLIYSYYEIIELVFLLSLSLDVRQIVFCNFYNTKPNLECLLSKLNNNNGNADSTEYWSVTSSNLFFAFQHFHDHISVEHGEKPSHTKFEMNRFMVA